MPNAAHTDPAFGTPSPGKVLVLHFCQITGVNRINDGTSVLARVQHCALHCWVARVVFAQAHTHNFKNVFLLRVALRRVLSQVLQTHAVTSAERTTSPARVDEPGIHVVFCHPWNLHGSKHDKLAGYILKILKACQWLIWRHCQNHKSQRVLLRCFLHIHYCTSYSLQINSL